MEFFVGDVYDVNLFGFVVFSFWRWIVKVRFFLKICRRKNYEEKDWDVK